MTRETVGARVTRRAQEYAALPLFRAFRDDAIPVERFPDFFREQYMTARWFQDVIWATTEIAEPHPAAPFAQEHRRRDSEHHRWMATDLERFGLPPMTDDDWFRLEWLPTRVQMARILARCNGASAEDRLVILACMESAGEVTLGTLHGYVERHGLAGKTLYLGDAHLGIEQGQLAEIGRVAATVLETTDERHLETVDLVFDALETMFSTGGDRYYGDLLCAPPR
jgi:hypothetical protein